MYELISVIVPVYKVEKYIHKCINSIIGQTYNKIEIILVDDGSPDNCGVICDEYAAKDHRIKVIHKPNGGLSDARNAALSMVTGSYITLIDSDDYWKPTYIENSYRYLKKNNVDLVVFPLCSFSEEGVVLKELNSGKEQLFTTEEALKMMFTSRLPWCAQGKLYKRELFDDIRYPVGILMEDKATTYKLFERCQRILFVECADYMYLIRKGSIMHSAFDKRQLRTLDIQEELNQHICSNHPTLHDVVLGYSSRVYLSTLFNMVGCKYPDNSAIETVVEGWTKHRAYLRKSDVVDVRYKYLSLISSFFYSLYGNKLYKSPTFKLFSKRISNILLSK